METENHAKNMAAPFQVPGSLAITGDGSHKTEKVEKVYVTMIDTFMSGWGRAKRKKNRFIVECDTLQQAETIERNALKRPEMRYVSISFRKPNYGPDVHESWKTYDQLRNVWKK